jgi:ABC-2 type transport system ATP-binding protein
VIALEIKGLTKVFKGKKRRIVQALSNLDLAVESGEIFGFLGPNGAGKSTTIKTVMGQVTATGGVANIFGKSATDPASRLKVGYLPENPAFYDFMTAREYLRFVGRAFAMGEGQIGTESDRVLQLLELAEAADRPVRGYSKGMVQRLGIAQTLLHDPDLYVLDEPMSGLDPLGRALVKDIIKELRQRGKTVFFSTHITADVEVVCDRVGVIVGGRLRVVDIVENILRSGIEGYSVQVSGCRGHADLFAGLDVKEKTADALEVYVPRAAFGDLMERVVKVGAEIDLIEPRRKSLESFFLEVVAGSMP